MHHFRGYRKGRMRSGANAARETGGRAPNRKLLVWDFPTRLFHWAAAALVALAYATVQMNAMRWHAWFGEALLALLLFRIAWGFFGSDTARFSSFLVAPAAAMRYLARALRLGPDRQTGHNPAGGWMVLLLLALLASETLTGLYIANDVADEGPLTDLTPAPIANAITAMHTIFWDALLAAIALHVLAIALYAVKGHNLLGPMIGGYKDDLPEGTPAPRMASGARAMLLLAGSAAVTAALASFM